MPLNLVTPSENSGGNFGFLSYKATGSLWSYRDETFKSIKVKPDDKVFTQAVFDLENIQTGWAAFTKGAPPIWVMDESIEQSAPKPLQEAENGGAWKRGFKVYIFSQQMFAQDDGVACWSTNATGANMGMGQLFEAWEQSRQDGMLPVVQIRDVEAASVGQGNTTVPVFEIVKHIAPPQQLLNVSAPISQVAGATTSAVSTVEEPEFA